MKQQIADIIITRGRAAGVNNLGITSIVKNRHGEMLRDYNIRLGNGRFKSLPKGLYDQLKQVQEKRNYTEADIDQMISQYSAQLNQINNQIQQNMSNYQNNSGMGHSGATQHLDPLAGGPNPFKKP